MKHIDSFTKISQNYNRLVSADFQIPTLVPDDGLQTLLSHAPITIQMQIKDGQVDEIVIHSSKDGDPAWDMVFEGFEQGMGWSSMNFYRAFRKSVSEHVTATGRAHGIKAVHRSGGLDDLTVFLTVDDD